MTTLRKRLQRLRDQGERGSILILVVLSALIIIGSAGLAVDVGRLYATKAELSRAVDAAALSGVLEFNGTPAGLTNASTKACAYLQANEPTASCSGIAPDGANSTLRISASKSVRLYFMPIFGINSSTVSAKATSGFNNATVDSVIVLDATGSMDGDPITQAKVAANNFKNTLLGSSPTGNVVIGINSFRGCWRPTTSMSATYPMPTSKTNCAPQSEVTGLTSSVSTITAGINAICPGNSCSGGSGTNTCGGLAKGWETLEGAGNHQSPSYPNNRRFLIFQSDGDNNYNGSYTYQSSPFDSAHTYQTFPCRPPLSCSNVGGDVTSGTWRCVSQVHTTAATEASDNWTSACNAWNGGSGWTAAWTRAPASGNDVPTLITNTTPFDTTCHVRMRGVGTICRGVDLSGVFAANLSYYVKRANWETADRFYIEANTTSCTATTGWTTLLTHDTANTPTSYGSATSVGLNSYAGATVYLRFRGGMNANDTTDQLYMDNVVVTSGTSAASTGYINGADGGSSCGDVSPRERQVDILTRNMANAIKADNIEIFVVAFGVCSSDSTVMTATDCSTNVGNTDHDNTSDQRLLKCIASSTSGTNDHYFYAATAAALPSIFTTIAAQIAHRLVE